MIHTDTSRETFLTRETILKLLSDEEVEAVSMAETAATLTEGEEYLDLEHLDLGVQKAHGATLAIGQTLERKAVHEETWTRIQAALKALARVQD